MAQLLCLLAISIATLSSATDCNGLHALLLRVNNLLKERHPKIVELLVEPAKRPSPDWHGELHAIARFNNGARHKVGSLSYDVKDGALSIDIEVEDGFRDAGVNHALVLKLLQDKPSIKKFPSYLTDRNLANFVVAITSEGTQEDVRRLRQL